MSRWKRGKTSVENTQTLSITNSDMLITSILISPDVEIDQVISQVTCRASVRIPLII
jgi:hypothetical protein